MSPSSWAGGPCQGPDEGPVPLEEEVCVAGKMGLLPGCHLCIRVLRLECSRLREGIQGRAEVKSQENGELIKGRPLSREHSKGPLS
jgi:hypothetical protein